MPNMIYGTAWKKENTTKLVEDALLSGFKAIDTSCPDIGVNFVCTKISSPLIPFLKAFSNPRPTKSSR